ncbi:hypothetical protein [Streptomyces sp. NPDC001661]
MNTFARVGRAKVRPDPFGLLCLLLAVLLSACSSGISTPDAASAKRPPKSRSATSDGGKTCGPGIRSGRLPTWTADRFGPRSVPHYALGEHHRILAVLFGYPYHAPSGGSARTNKIRWVPRDDASGDVRLTIEATLASPAQRVTRVVDLGSSIVDLPQAGCWRLSLSWPGNTDRVYLDYRPQQGEGPDGT